MKHIYLKHNKGFSWFEDQHIKAKGYFFDASNTLYQKEQLLAFFSKVKTPADFKKALTEINGVYTIIISFDNFLCVASDASRIFPVFYTKYQDQIYISDSIQFLKEKLHIRDFNTEAELEFVSAAHTLGNKTLLKEVKQIQSGEYLIFKNHTLSESGFSFSYSTKHVFTETYSDLKKQAIRFFEETFTRLVKSLGNRQAVVPLSAGYDSRFIVTMLKKLGYTDVLCYTYGKKDNFEVENSKRTANALGYPWVFIEYNTSLISGYVGSDTFKEFVDFTANLSSMPILQEYFAVKYLKEHKLIKDDAVFIPGHSGDLIGGSQLIKVIPENLTTSDIVALILKEKFQHNRLHRNDKETIRKTIQQLLVNFDPNYKEKHPYTVVEDYDIKEKICKYIFNSSNVYLFFGYELRFPYWDLPLLNFFKSVSFKEKEIKKLYDDVLANTYFKQFQVDFENELQPSKFDLIFQKVKNRIKPLLPKKIRKKLLLKNDWLHYSIVTNEMVSSMSENNLSVKKEVASYNEYIIQWYLYYCKGAIKNDRKNVQ